MPGSFVTSSWVTISDASHSIELDWRAATSAGANDGSFTLWIDGVEQGSLSGLDNDTWRIDQVRLGALASFQRVRAAPIFSMPSSRAEVPTSGLSATLLPATSNR